jgi:transposase
VDAIPAIAGLPGRPRKRPSKLHADKGYDYKRCRAHLRQRGIASRIARRGVESSERLGKHRWVVERTHGWFAGFGKLRIRFERRLDIHEALRKLAAAIICARFVLASLSPFACILAEFCPTARECSCAFSGPTLPSTRDAIDTPIPACSLA